MEFDLTIERHQVVQAAQENGWGRRAAPHFDYLDRRVPGGALTEVQVFYSEYGVVNSAALIDHSQRTRVPAEPDNGLGDVLGWLSAPAHS